jgi:hypothetical protein
LLGAYCGNPLGEEQISNIQQKIAYGIAELEFGLLRALARRPDG